MHYDNVIMRSCGLPVERWAWWLSLQLVNPAAILRNWNGYPFVTPVPEKNGEREKDK